jgi:O-antigen ligase
MHSISQRPLTGYGLGAFWIEPLGPSYYVREVLNWDVPSAHNNWLEMGLNFGWPGIVLLAVILVIAIGRAVVRTFTTLNPWIAAGLAQLFVFSLSESTIIWFPNTYASVLFVFYVALAFLPASQSAVPQRRSVHAARRTSKMSVSVTPS